MNKKKILISSLLTILVSTGLVVGATYSLFTSESTHNITVGSGIVSVTSSVDKASMQLLSMDEVQSGTFANGGTATLEQDGTFVLTNITPGDAVKFKVNIKNESNVAVKYKVSLSKGSEDLASKLTLEGPSVTKWADLAPAPTEGVNNGILTDYYTLSFPNGDETDNDYQTKDATAKIQVLAIQANAPEAQDYTLTLVSDYGNPEALTYQPGENIVLPTLEEAGQTFEGWFSDVERVTPFETITMPESDLTAYAKWTPVS